MKYLLDTNACIGFLTGRAPGVLKRVKSLPPAEIAVCSVVKAELFYGAARSAAPERTLATQREFLDQFASLDFDDRAAEVAGRIRGSWPPGVSSSGPTTCR